MADPGDPTVVDNPAQLRYELRLGEEVVGVIGYRLGPGLVILNHTELSPSVAGRGLGGRLVTGALEDIRAQGLRVVAQCPFVAAFLRRHPEHADLVADDAARPS